MQAIGSWVGVLRLHWKLRFQVRLILWSRGGRLLIPRPPPEVCGDTSPHMRGRGGVSGSAWAYACSPIHSFSLLFLLFDSGPHGAQELLRVKLQPPTELPRHTPACVFVHLEPEHKAGSLFVGGGRRQLCCLWPGRAPQAEYSSRLLPGDCFVSLPRG